MLSLFVALILWAISLDNGKSEDDTPKPQTLVDHIVMYTLALQIFSAIGQICSVVSSLYRLDVVLSRTPKPRTRVESVGGRRGPIRVSQFAMSETLGPPVSVPCVREMLVNRRQDLVRPRYAAVGVATIGLSMIASLCIARTYLPDRMFHPVSHTTEVRMLPSDQPSFSCRSSQLTKQTRNSLPSPSAQLCPLSSSLSPLPSWHTVGMNPHSFGTRRRTGQQGIYKPKSYPGSIQNLRLQTRYWVRRADSVVV